MAQIKYKKGYKYQLAEKYQHNINIAGFEVNEPFFTLSVAGHLTVYAGYAWDGASGGIDTPSIMRGSLVHDVLCQMVAHDLLPGELQWKIDCILHRLCLHDGMLGLRAWYVYKAVRLHFRGGNKPQQRPTIKAP